MKSVSVVVEPVRFSVAVVSVVASSAGSFVPENRPMVILLLASSSEAEISSPDSQESTNEPILISDSNPQTLSLDYDTEIKVKNEDVLGELSTLNAENSFSIKFENDDGYTKVKEETKKADSEQKQNFSSSDFSANQSEKTQNSYYSQPMSSKDSEINFESNRVKKKNCYNKQSII